MENRARKGDAKSIATLEAAAAIPEPLEYLADVFWRLDGLRESDMNGPKRLTVDQIRGAVEMFGWALTPLDVEGLVMLDIAALHPGDWPSEDGE